MFISRRNTALFQIVVLAVIALFPVVAFSQERARLIGKVVDPDGKPIEGVSVTITSPQLPNFREVRTTDKKGVFLIDYRDINVTYRYRFDKAGFQSVDAQQQWNLEGTQRYTWTMPVGQSAVGGPAPVSASEPAIEAFNAGAIALNGKDYKAAEAKFKEAVAHDPKLVRAWVALSTAALQAGDNQEAVDAAEKAIELGSTDETALLARYQAYRNMKEDAKAAQALKDMQDTGRRTEEAKKVHNEAVALEKAGDHAGAFAKFQEALQLDPNLEPSLLGLAETALQLGKNAEAATAAEAVLKLDPNNGQALRLRYNACLALGDKDRLAQALVGLAAVEPAIARNGLLKLAFDAYDANDQVTAKKRFLQVIAVDPNEPLSHYYLGLLYVNEGAFGDARTQLERFIALAPDAQQTATARQMLQQLPKKH